MEIITAGDGTAHVSSADDGAIYAGIAGPQCYVTNVGEKLSCVMQSANSALIGTGVGFMYGRAFRVSAPESVTIESGTQAQRRADIICAHFKTSSEGKESGELCVIKGTPTSSQDVVDPSIPSGDILQGATDAYMPLYRIKLDGINASDPEPLFSILAPMAEIQSSVNELRDSVSQRYVVKTFGPFSGKAHYAQKVSITFADLGFSTAPEAFTHTSMGSIVTVLKDVTATSATLGFMPLLDTSQIWIELKFLER